MKSTSFIVCLFILPFLCLASSFQSPLNFEGNSKLMMDELFDATPIFFRGLVRRSFFKAIEDQGFQHVTEDCIYQVVQTIIPNRFLGSTLELLDHHRS
jgi:hypothetical protein